MNSAADNAVVTAVGQSANICNQVATFDEAAYSYYDQAQNQRFIDKMNELINALKRW